MNRTLIRNADFVVTVDKTRRIIKNGSIAFEDDRIIAVGKQADIPSDLHFDEIIEANGKMVLPGIIDTHLHTAQQLGRGLADHGYGPERLLRRLWVVESHMDEGDALCAIRLSQLELIRAGVTCFADPGNYFPAQAAQAISESGIRGLIARTVMDMGQTAIGTVPNGFYESLDLGLARADEVIEQYNGSADGRIKAWFSMRVPVSCSDELLVRLNKLALKRNVGIIGHACESRDETVASHLKYGIGDVARLEKLGVLGPHFLLLHVGWADTNELNLLKKRDVKISISPGSSFHHGMGNISHGKMPEMREMGITLSLGSDSAMSGNFLDTIRQTYLLVGGYQDNRLDPKVVRPETAVEMMTLGGARSILWDKEIGSLEVGKKADITILNIERPEWQPIHNPISNLVFCAHGGCADTVIVNGKFVMRSGVVKTLNEADLYEEAKDRAFSLARRAGLAELAKSIWPVV